MFPALHTGLFTFNHFVVSIDKIPKILNYCTTSFPQSVSFLSVNFTT
jgi:hypothetical protein